MYRKVMLLLMLLSLILLSLLHGKLEYVTLILRYYIKRTVLLNGNGLKVYA